MARPFQPAMPGLRALVLDPDPGSLRALAWALEARFFSVATAPDGTRGLDLLLDELLALDVVVIDAGLPGRDALAFARLIREAGGERDLAIVVVAASPVPALSAALLAAGVDAVVDRRDGPDAAALTAVAAVATRAARPPAASAPAPAPRREAVAVGFVLPLALGWSMPSA